MNHSRRLPPGRWPTVAATLFTGAILSLGYFSFGAITTVIFASGFFTGLILWLIFPRLPSYDSIRIPYILTFALFIVHRIEEKFSGFFPELSRITEVPTPDPLAWNVILLVLASVGAWCAIPWLTKREHPLGCYLAWTFFSAMGITEMAHFVFPLFVNRPYGYFPGMASVVLLAPAAWWGLARLWRAPSVWKPEKP